MQPPCLPRAHLNLPMWLGIRDRAALGGASASVREEALWVALLA